MSTLDLESVAFPYQIGCGLAGVNLGRLRVILPPSTVDIPIYNLPLAAGKKSLVSIHSAID